MGSNLFPLAGVLLCAIPGAVIFLGGAGVTMLGFLADGRQLKMDTNLERKRVIRFGLFGLGIGLILAIIPLGAWLVASPR